MPLAAKNIAERNALKVTIVALARRTRWIVGGGVLLAGIVRRGYPKTSPIFLALSLLITFRHEV